MFANICFGNKGNCLAMSLPSSVGSASYSISVQTRATNYLRRWSQCRSSHRCITVIARCFHRIPSSNIAMASMIQTSQLSGTTPKHDAVARSGRW